MKIPPNLILITILIVGGFLLLKSPTVVTTTNPILEVTPTTVPVTDKVQILKATYGPPTGFYPIEFTVKAGQPVRLEVLATENGRGCMGSIMVPDFLPDDIQFFTKGETNVFEFTPTIPGEYQITCGMGIPHASLVVK
ncbi:MAG: cupredoxin domain-containing protein [Candidatus Shapirobacteria bacterium]|nr:cupredoxin domain-containing protein [Candidatus Shapirobacteria bacterium]